MLARLISSMELADLDAAQAEVRELGRIADELRQPARRWMATAPRVLLALAVGRFDAAESLIEQAYRVGVGHDESTAAFGRMLQSFLLRRERGELEDVADEVEGSVDDFPHYALTLWSVVADLRVQLGREDEARRALARVASDGFGGVPRDNGWLFALTLAADVCGALDDERDAAELYDLLLPFEGRLAVFPLEGYLGTVSRALGVVATTNRLWRDGEAHFERALETDRALGARPWIAHDLHDFARMLAARAGPGDTERARRLAMEAVDAYRELPMGGWAERALPLVEASVPGPG